MDYGRAGRIGIGTPQANPTVEAEAHILLPRRFTLHATRLRSRALDPSTRLIEYLNGLDESLAAFDSFRPDIFGFACTGSSYLVGRPGEEAIVAEAEARAGYPVITATAAIAWALERLGTRRIALVSPYPYALGEAARRYWNGRGIDVVRAAQVATSSNDTRSIYDLSSNDARPLLDTLDCDGVDAVLLSGTGLPTLSLLADWPHGIPLLSSNACLVAHMLARLGRDDLVEPKMLRISGWRQRLAEALD
jgi:maleate isomerase